ncbi:uncharacterized protein [Rutidosis leptorrhynchoides]|uniref:uncharacterized protein n=1 Tax=Rutidosis leptorrhynchoides TaxID=125765 RepID=UPI003A9911F8
MIIRRINLWDMLDKLLNIGDISWVLCGDFNEVREHSERFNCLFVKNRAKRFNDFISRNQLIEIPLGGRRYTRVIDYGFKLRKLDRFLVSEIFLQLWVELKALALERDRSDHCPIILQDKSINFGSKPFKFFDEWLHVDGIDIIVASAWNDNMMVGDRKD